MNILVINSGSSSIKFSIFDGGASAPRLVLDGELSGVGGAKASLRMQGEGIDGGETTRQVKAESLTEAIELVLEAVAAAGRPKVEAVGYRVVHPGAKLRDHQRITAEVLRDLEAAAEFAPLHDPEAVEAIRGGMARFGGIGHYACFDTIFHQTMPLEATTYPLPARYAERGVKRYGFHGLSCESVVQQLRESGEEVPRRMAIAHLGSGCSVTAVVDGRSIDTTMGLTPTGGVAMGTRPGDLDPGLMIYLMRQEDGDRGAASAALETMLNHESGMVALSGLPNDMKAVRKAAEAGDEKARLAIKVFARSVGKAIGGFAWLMGGLDAVVFTGGIGEHDGATRREVVAHGGGVGVSLDSSRNDASACGVRRIHSSASEVAVWVVPAEEDLMIALHVRRMADLAREA